jgi:hypothetical protein
MRDGDQRPRASRRFVPKTAKGRDFVVRLIILKRFLKKKMCRNNRNVRAWRDGPGGFLLAAICLAACASAARGQGAWNVRVVDDGHGANVGKFTSLAIDHDGNFHVAYYDESHNVMRYAYRGSGDKQWYTMIVDTQAGQFASLAVDSQDHPHLVYNSRFLTGLHYAFFDGTHWQTQIIDHDRTNHFTSVQVDAKGYPHISYYKEENPDRTVALHLKYAFFDGKIWYVQTVSQKYATGKFNSIAVDSSGRPHIAYSFAGTGDLGYVFWDGSQWVYEVPDTRRTHNNYVGQGNSIALDSRDHPHIAYFDLNNRAIKYTQWTGTVWQTEFVDKVVGDLGQGQADHLSLRLDTNDQPHVAYYDRGIGVLKYAQRDEKGWHVELVDRGNVGEYPSLCLDNKNEPYITYYDAADGQLRIAQRESRSDTAIARASHP